MRTIMFMLRRARTNEIYRNCLKSMLIYDVTLKCFMSSNSKKIDDVLNFMQKKSTKKTEKKKLQMKTANRLFELAAENVDGKVYEENKQLSNEDLTSKINELIKSAEAVPDTSSDKLEITKAERTPRKALKNENNDKENFLFKAKQVAVALGVDVEMTQKELLQAFESIGGSDPDSSEQFGKGYSMKPSLDFQEKVRETNVFRDIEKSSLNIFKKKVEEKETGQSLQTWNELEEITLLSSSFRPAKNYFDELINWTHQGKLWRFPIDNDQDWDEEIATDFTDHIFLDIHLEPWCPKKGPIRHFMELVTTGLSKNPYLSAEKKKKHIMWFRDYFLSKSSLLTELGAIDSKNDVKNVEKLEAGGNTS